VTTHNKEAAEREEVTEADACADVASRVRYEDGMLYWVNARNPMYNGRVVGRIDACGYYRTNTTKGYGKVKVHRLIFFMHHGYLPAFVDHVDGNPLNNKIDNLRAATREQNMHNMKTPVTNTSGRKGVYWNKGSRKWQASIRVNDRLRYLGLYEQFNDAVAARERAERELHGEFARH
jgi:hypothetical protein